jgi:hypothetical protein
MPRSDLKDDVLMRLRGESMIRFIESLGYSTRRSGSEWKILCPFHDDHRPSMGINPHKGGGNGIFKCFSCGWGGDVFDFVGQAHGVNDFKDQLHLIAEKLGLSTKKVTTGSKPAPRAVEKRQPKVEVMTPADVLDHYREATSHAEPLAPWAEQLVPGIETPNVVMAMEMIGAVVVQRYGRMVLVVPMRDSEGTLCSLRFRDFETKKRWSLDVKKLVDGKRQQVKMSRSGLMTYDEFFDPDICNDGTVAVIIEGETSLIAAVAMMIRDYESEPHLWPARWVALPGVGACHDIVLACPLSKVAVTFFDDDEAGRRAVFNHRSTMMVETDGKKRQVPNLDAPPRKGLLHKLIQLDITAAAAFPPKSEKKYDLRDWVNDGLTWAQFHEYVLSHATRDPSGSMRRDERPTAETRMDGEVTGATG